MGNGHLSGWGGSASFEYEDEHSKKSCSLHQYLCSLHLTSAGVTYDITRSHFKYTVRTYVREM
jgi:hypothetical protein